MKEENRKKYEKKVEVLNMIYSKFENLSHTQEDINLICEMVETYYRKRQISYSNNEIMAAGFLWLYSKINFFWEGNKKWTRQGIAELFALKKQTIGNKATELGKALKIRQFDDQFCRQDVIDKNPLNNFVMLENGMIGLKNNSLKAFTPFYPKLAKQIEKEDYYYDALDMLEEGKEQEALNSLNKALEIDNEYVDAYNGLGFFYFFDDIEKSKEYYEKAYQLTKKHFKHLFPNELEWAVTENRQYLRAMHGLGLIFWRKNNFEEAKRLFSLMLKINKNDNQGIRYCMAAILKGLTWEEFGKKEDKASENGNYDEIEKIVEEQNKIHHFWEYEEEH